MLYPPEIYEAVRAWAIKEYGWEGRPVVRPFYPGGDYENFAYPEGCVVIDNPPFSIVSKIAAFYESRKISYFLFAPGLTLLAIRAATSHIGVGAAIRYANGAIVNTSFVCSEGPLLRSAPDLYKILNDIHKRTMTVTKNRQIAYRYPDGLITGTTLNSFSRYGVAYSSDVGERVGHIDSQAVLKKSIFGGGYIVPRQKAAEAKRAALKAREEKLRQEILSRIKGEEAIAVRLEGGEEQ